MLTYLAEFSSLFSPFNVFRYITFRTGGATATALLFVFWFGPAIISALIEWRNIRHNRGNRLSAFTYDICSCRWQTYCS